MSILKANIGGICDQVDTEEELRGCGLATILMECCFTDDMVGGVNVHNNEKFEMTLGKNREMATQTCKHIVFLRCLPNLDKYAACSAYFTAAINTKHSLMLILDDTNMDVMNVAEAQTEFKKDATGWIQDYGYEWFFCQCKV